MREPDPAIERRNALTRRFLAGFWIAWAIWLVARPVEFEETSLTPGARRQLAIFAFALLFFVSYGLFRTWRWPVTASRALVVALIVGVVIGPRGRDAWIFGIDIVFATAGFVAAFLIMKMGVAPAPKRASDMLTRRMERREERLRRYRR